MRKSPRDRRLSADLRSVEKLTEESSIFTFLAKGNLPQRYTLVFDGMGISRNSAGKIVPTSHHEVVVELGAAYPRMVPNLAWQTPIFHPNISNNGVVCLGGYGTHWVPSLTLAEMCTMLWDMIRYKNFDIASPYNRQAALWAQSQTHFSFPVDGRPIRNLIAEPKPGASAGSNPNSHQPSPTHWTQRLPLIGSRLANMAQANGSAPLTVEMVDSAEVVEVEAVVDPTETVVDPADSDPNTDSNLTDDSDPTSNPPGATVDVEVTTSESDSPQDQLLDPSEIEVVIPGIQIISSNLDNSNLDRDSSNISSSATVQQPPTPESEADNGIIFLD
jgi:ubiquitin-protein ligase